MGMGTEIGVFADSLCGTRSYWCSLTWDCTVANVLRTWLCFGIQTWHWPTLAPLTLVILQDPWQAVAQQSTICLQRLRSCRLGWGWKENRSNSTREQDCEQTFLPSSAEDSCSSPAERARAVLEEWLQIFKISWRNQWPGYNPNQVEIA